MKHFQSVLALLGMLAVLVGILSGCSSSQRPPDQSQAPSASDSATGTEEPTTPAFDYESSDRLDPTLNYNNEKFSIYTWNTQMITDWITEDSGELSTVDSTIYQHLKYVEERLKLDITITEVPGRYAQMSSFLETLETYIKAGLSPDLVDQYSLSSSTGMTKGLYADLMQANNIDFEAPWWSDSLIENNTIHNKLYYITGDMTPTVTYNMHAMMFNQKLIDSYQLESPYRLVEEGNWTLSTFQEMIRDTALNPDSNGTYDASGNVMYGLYLYKGAVDALQTGFGIKAITKQSTGDSWTLSEEFTGDRAVNMVDTIRKLAHESQDVFYDGSQEYIQSLFFNGHAIFNLCSAYYIEHAIRDRKMEVGVVPTPKYDAVQQNYGTRLAVTVSMFSIPAGLQENYERSAAVIEALAIDGYRNVTPVIFEKTFCARYAERPEDMKMFLLIRDSITYDPGDFNEAIGSYSAFRNCVFANSSWTTFLEGRMSRFTKALADINDMKD